MTKLIIPERAVILAAGYGSRLRPLTDHRPKPLVEVNGVSILHNALNQLERIGVKTVTIVVGYRKDAIEYACGERLGGMDIHYVVSPAFASTGSAYSLWMARDTLLAGDVLLLEGDVVFEFDCLVRLTASSAPDAATVAPFDERMEGSAVILAPDGMIKEVRMRQTAANISGDGPSLFKTMNLMRLSARTLRETLVPALDAYIENGQTNLYIEQMLAELIGDGLPLMAVDCDGLKWYEVDNVEDLRIAETMFLQNAIVEKAGSGLYSPLSMSL